MYSSFFLFVCLGFFFVCLMTKCWMRYRMTLIWTEFNLLGKRLKQISDAAGKDLLVVLGFFLFVCFSKIYLFIYFLFMAVLRLRFCARAFSSCGKWGPLFIAVRGPLTIVASLVAEHRLQTRRLSSCGSWAQPPHGMWDPPRPGLEPVSPALSGGIPTTAPPGKPGPFSFEII